MSRRRRIAIVAALAAVAALVGAVAFSAGAQTPAPEPNASASTPARADEPAPDALAFDHTVHAAKLAMACLGCHVYAAESPVAGLPSARKCMGCHKFVAKEKPAIQALAKLFDAGKAPKWTRVFRLPDYIYFSHRMHVRAKVECDECHGNVASMTTVVQTKPFTMGRCLACHDERHATHDCVNCHK